MLSFLNLTNGLTSNKCRVVTLSKFYPTIIGIIIHCLKSKQPKLSVMYMEARTDLM